MTVATALKLHGVWVDVGVGVWVCVIPRRVGRISGVGWPATRVGVSGLRGWSGWGRWAAWVGVGVDGP
eukprot:6432268-Prorocentrum_lima.AAC.1